MADRSGFINPSLDGPTLTSSMPVIPKYSRKCEMYLREPCSRGGDREDAVH